MSTPWPGALEQFMNEVKWTFAKTYAETWPHEYIVKDRVDQDCFRKAVIHIREHGDLKPSTTTCSPTLNRKGSSTGRWFRQGAIRGGTKLTRKRSSTGHQLRNRMKTDSGTVRSHPDPGHPSTNQPSPPAPPGGLLHIDNTPVKTGVLWDGGWYYGPAPQPCSISLSSTSSIW